MGPELHFHDCVLTCVPEMPKFLGWGAMGAGDYVQAARALGHIMAPVAAAGGLPNFQQLALWFQRAPYDTLAVADEKVCRNVYLVLAWDAAHKPLLTSLAKPCPHFTRLQLSTWMTP